MESRERMPFLAPFPLLRGWRGSGGTQQPQGVLDSPGDGFFSIFHLSVCSPGSRELRCPCPPGLTCQFLSHLPSLGSWRGFWTSAGCVAPAPAARLLANSDSFSFSVLSWVPLFLTVHFLWTQDLKKKKPSHRYYPCQPFPESLLHSSREPRASAY